MPIVDLYDASGTRQVASVYLSDPRPYSFRYQGQMFLWSHSAGRYCAAHGPQYAEQAQAHPLLEDYRRRVLEVVHNRGPEPLNWIPSVVAADIEALPLIPQGVSTMPPMTHQQQQMAQALGLDLTKIDWQKIAQIVQMVLDLFKAQPAMLATASADAHDHETLSCEAVCAAGESMLAAVRVHEACCQH